MKKFLVTMIVLTMCASIFSFSLVSKTNAVSVQNLNNLAIQSKISTSIVLSPYVSPIILYNDQANQPIILVVTDQNNDYVTDATFTAKYEDKTLASFTVKEISKGFYKLILDTTGITQPTIKFTSVLDNGSDSISSNSVIISLRDKGVFNPYVDVDTIYSVDPYGQGSTECVDDIARSVFDKLPCTIGNAFEVNVGSWPVTDPANWYIHNVETVINGPVKKIGDDRYVVEKAGEVIVSINTIAWERENPDCPAWDTEISEDEMSTNAGPYLYSKTFDICKTEEEPILSKVSLQNGEQTDETTIEAGKSADLVFNINEGQIPSVDLSTKIVHIYMTDGCNILLNAFTINAKKITEIWYNQAEASQTNISEIPVTFNSTTSSLEFEDKTATLTFSDIQFNYPNCSDSGYHLVVQVFAKQKQTFPLINETLDNIQIAPIIKILNATVALTEGSSSIEPDKILAGVNSTINISDPHFTLGEPEWAFTFNDESVEGTVKETNNGYEITLNHSLNDAGDLEILGYAYDIENHYSKKEQTIIKIPVVRPEFTVQIGLEDGSKIDNDSIITEGFVEDIYGTVTDPRGIHDFSTDWKWTFKPEANHTSYGIPLSRVFYYDYQGVERFPIWIIGCDNPCMMGDPTFDLYFVASDSTRIYIDTFTLVSPTVTVDPEEVPSTIPASATLVTFSVTDAHGHGMPAIDVTVSSEGWEITAGTTGPDGELHWPFVPPKSDLYNISISSHFDAEKYPPCGWPENGASAIIEAVDEASVIDTEAPVVTATAGEIVEGAVTISGRVEDNVGVVSLYIGAMKVNFLSDGTFSADVALNEGENKIKVVAFDAAGNKGEQELTVDYAMPKVTVITLQPDNAYMTVNGVRQEIDPGRGTKPVIIPEWSRTVVPIRAIVEALGGTISWIPKTRGITILLGDIGIGLQIGNSTAVVKGSPVKIDPNNHSVKPIIINDRTMLPLRFVAESLGCDVGWDSDTRTITITYGG